MLIYVALMAEGFFGYLLPWGQMSYWGAQVIISLFGALPIVGDPLVEWIRGDYNISDITLNRFFALHVIALPLALVMLVVMHILALHETGSNNPDGIEIKKTKGPDGIPLDGIAFHPYYTSKDLVAIIVFLILFFSVVFFAPEMGGYFLEHANFEPANTLKTPEHIAPVWYFTPFYAILRAVPSKLGGVLLLGSAIFVLFFLPWLDRCKVKSIRYRGWDYKIPLTVFATSFIVLGYLGLKPAIGIYTFMAQIFTAFYYGFFIYLAVYTGKDKGVTLRTGVAFSLVLLIIGLLFSDTLTLGFEELEAPSEIAIYASAWLFSLIYSGFFMFLCFYAGREPEGPVPDRLN